MPSKIYTQAKDFIISNAYDFNRNMKHYKDLKNSEIDNEQEMKAKRKQSPSKVLNASSHFNKTEEIEPKSSRNLTEIIKTIGCTFNVAGFRKLKQPCKICDYCTEKHKRDIFIWENCALKCHESHSKFEFDIADMVNSERIWECGSNWHIKHKSKPPIQPDIKKSGNSDSAVEALTKSKEDLDLIRDWECELLYSKIELSRNKFNETKEIIPHNKESSSAKRDSSQKRDTSERYTYDQQRRDKPRRKYSESSRHSEIYENTNEDDYHSSDFDSLPSPRNVSLFISQLLIILYRDSLFTVQRQIGFTSY